MRKMMTMLLVAGCSIGLARGLNADEANVESEQAAPLSAWKGRVFALGDSDLKQGGASYAISSVALELEHRHWQLGLERQYFAWRNADAFVEETGGREPWEFFNRVQLGFSHQQVHSERWMSEILVGGMLGFEKQVADSFTGYLGGYGLYSIHPRLMLMLGVYYSRHQEIATDFDLIPILGLAWNPRTTLGFSAQLGLPSTHACWHFDERTRLVLDLNMMEGGVTRLANDSPVRERGYVELVSAAITLRLERRLWEDLDLSVGLGHSVHREMKIYDKDGRNRRSVEIERGPGIEISLRKPF